MEFQEYRAWLLSALPDPVVGWLGADRAEQLVQADFTETIRTRTSLSAAARFRRACFVPSTVVGDYLLRRVEGPGGASLLAGIHFRGGDVARPFVGVYAQSRHLTRTEVLAAGSRLAEAFSVFAPAPTWWWRPNDARDLDGLPGESADKRLVVGHLDTIRRSPMPGSATAIGVRQDPDGSSYEAYLGMYERFFAAEPSWRGRLSLTEPSDYLACAQVGGLVTVEREGKTVGVIAARPGSIRGIPGWEMMEEILDAGTRGLGVAARAQRLLLERLDTTLGELVFGTIHAGNAPSRRTALRVGRLDVGGWVFVPAAG